MDEKESDSYIFPAFTEIQNCGYFAVIERGNLLVPKLEFGLLFQTSFV